MNWYQDKMYTNSFSSGLSTHKLAVWAFLLVLLYLGINLVGMNRTLIPDEIRPLLLAAKPLNEQLDFARGDIIHPPLSYMIHRGWLQIFGHTDAAAKASALLMGSATIVLFTFLAGRVTKHWRLLALLFCTPYFRIGSAVNLVRMYGLLLFFTVVAILLWDRWRKKSSNYRLAAWVFVMTLAVYTHASALLLLPAFVAVNWVYGPRRWAFTAAAAVPIVSLIPWGMAVHSDFLERGIEANVVAIFDNPTRVLLRFPFLFLSGENPGGANLVPPFHQFGLQRALKAAAVMVNLSLLVIALPTIRQHWPPRRDGNESMFWFLTAVLLCGVPVAVLYGFSLVILPVLNARYLLIALPAYWMLLVLLAELGGRANRLILVGIILSWVLVSASLTLVQHLEQSRARQGTQMVAAEASASDMILVDSHWPLGWQIYWEWTRRLGQGGRVEILWSQMPDWTRNNPPGTRLFELDIGESERVWFFHDGDSALGPVTEYLTSKGFEVDQYHGANYAYLTVFIKNTSDNVSDSGYINLFGNQPGVSMSLNETRQCKFTSSQKISEYT